MTTDECKIGIMRGYIHKGRSVGVAPQSGTRTYEAVWQLDRLGIDGYPVNGTRHLDVLKMFEEAPNTEAVIKIGEIGGTGEEDAASIVKEKNEQVCDSLRCWSH